MGCRNGDRNLPGGDRAILDRGCGFYRRGDRWLPDRWFGMPAQVAAGPTNTFLTNLYAYYKCDEASGALTDSSGNNRNINVNTGTISSAAGVISTSRSFPGTTAYFMAGNNTLFSPQNNHFSFTLWVWLNSTAQSGNDTGLLSKATAAATYEWLVWYSPVGQPLRIVLGASSDGLGGANFKGVVSGGAQLAANQWYHVAGGWDGANLWLVLNGGTRTLGAFTGPVFRTADMLAIGLELGSAGPLNGRLDEIGFWQARDLSNAEVLQLYNGGAGLPFSSFT